MALFESLLEWSRVTFLPYGELGLFFVAVMEMSFFPVPPDILLLPLTLLNPELGIYYALVATAGSAVGAIIGYLIGLKGGRPVVERLVSKDSISKVEKYYNKYGVLAIGIAAFTPIPDKIFTLGSGVLRYSPSKLVFGVIIGRAARFFPQVFLVMLFGEQFIDLISKYFGIVTLAIAIPIIVYYYRRYFKRRKASEKPSKGEATV